MNFQWDDSYSVGVPQIDEQHKVLFGIMHELSLALSRGQGRYTIDRFLARLADYTHYHFDSEESLMEAYDYPGVERHKRQHQHFKRELAELILRHQEGENMVKIGTYNALRDWLLRHVTDHTQGPDQMLARFIKTGISEEVPPPPTLSIPPASDNDDPNGHPPAA